MNEEDWKIGTRISAEYMGLIYANRGGRQSLFEIQNRVNGLKREGNISSSQWWERVLNSCNKTLLSRRWT